MNFVAHLASSYATVRAQTGYVDGVQTRYIIIIAKSQDRGKETRSTTEDTTKNRIQRRTRSKLHRTHAKHTHTRLRARGFAIYCTSIHEKTKAF